MKERFDLKKKILTTAVILSVIFTYQLFVTADCWAKEKVTFAQEVSYGLEEPVDEVIGSNGEIYVLDKKLSRVFVYSNDGQLIRNFGTRGSMVGQMLNPEAIALTLKGDVVVSDTGNQRVLMFNKSGVYVKELGKTAKGLNLLKEPNSIAISPKGKIYVSDKRLKTITMFDGSGILMGRWQLNNVPFDIAFDQSDRLYILFSANKRIGQYTSQLKKIKDFTTNMSHLKRKIDIQDLTVDHWGDIYLVERRSHKIVKINQKKKILFAFGSKGDGNGQFDQPEGIVTDGKGYLYIADSRNKRVQKLYMPESKKRTNVISKILSTAKPEQLAKTIAGIRSKFQREKKSEYITITGTSRPLIMERSTDDIRIQMSKKLLIKDLKRDLASQWGILMEDMDRSFEIVKEVVLNNGRVQITMGIPKEIISKKYTVLTMK